MNDAGKLSLDMRELLLELRMELASLYDGDLADLVLYGSRARGDAEKESDVDVLVVLKGEVNPSREVLRTSGILSDLSLRHDAVISCVFVSEAEYSVGKGPLIRNILREGIRI